MTVLLHKSHCSETRPDGWSGAPGEAAWVRTLVPQIMAELSAKGIQSVAVDGDYDPLHDTDQTYLSRHPEFLKDYSAFLALHYDADIYQGAGGWFWDRATGSTTAADDDRLGRIFEIAYASLQGPSPHFERRNANTNGYYGFRCTSVLTPGILVEHGVGWGADKDWLRSNLIPIAKAHALVISEFLGLEDDVSFNNDPEVQQYVKDVAATFDAIKAIQAQQASDLQGIKNALAGLAGSTAAVQNGINQINARLDKLHQI